MDRRKRHRMNANAEEYLASRGRDSYRAETGEEFAAEMAPDGSPVSGRSLGLPEEDRPGIGGREFRGGTADRAAAKPSGIGWVALITAFLSLFLWPYVLGPAAALLGIAAFVQGSRSLGIWSAVIGIISMLSYWVLVPIYA